jgi:hypothetical protein
MINLSVFEVIGEIAVASEDGQKIYERICAVFDDGGIVVLDFKKITMLAPSFINSAIGQLYGKYSDTRIACSLFYINTDFSQIQQVQHVLKSAIKFYENPEKAREPYDKELGKDE